MRHILLLVACFLVMGCAANRELLDESVADVDTSAIYGAVFDHVFSDDEPTQIYYVREKYADPPSQEDIPEADGIFEGYKFLNSSGVHSKSDFGNRNVVLISQREIERLFRGGCEVGWERFYQEYTETRMLVGFSNVALKQNSREAAIYFEFGSDCLRGMGSIAYLVKNDGAWTVETGKYIWGGY